jgi:acetyl esterase
MKPNRLLLIFTLLCSLACAEEKLDVTYGIATGEDLKLDLDVPDGAGPFPVCILVHGGGFVRGDKQKQFKPLFAPLKDAGFAWVTINYRFAPLHKYPGSVEDTETAILWVKAHASEYNFDPTRIALIGESAGAYLTSLVGARNHEDTRVAAVVSFYGPAELVTRFAASNGKPSTVYADYFGVTEDSEATRKFLTEASPATYVRPGLPPFLLLHGNKDETVPYEQSVILYSRLKEAGVAAEFITIEGGGHGISSWKKLDSDYLDQVLAWLKKTLKN